MTTVAPVTHGVTTAAVELGGFRLTETSHARNTRLNAHEHAHPAITFVLAGAFTERFGPGREYACTTMTVLRKPAGATHSNVYSSAGARSFILECTVPSPLYAGLDTAPSLAAARAAPGMLALYEAFRNDGPDRLLLAEEVALELSRGQAGLASRTGTNRPSWLANVIDMIHDDCTLSLSLAALAAEVGVHPVYLARVFRRHFGQSVGQYVLQCRLRLAMHHLTVTGAPISRVAQECGFTDQSHFTRRFAREVGVSPARFRRTSGALDSAAAQ